MLLLSYVPHDRPAIIYPCVYVYMTFLRVTVRRPSFRARSGREKYTIIVIFFFFAFSIFLTEPDLHAKITRFRIILHSTYYSPVFCVGRATTTTTIICGATDRTVCARMDDKESGETRETESDRKRRNNMRQQRFREEILG